MPKTRIKTYDRIVQESLTLFNEHGERNITTNHIAAHLGISPGNLYYHFRNKEEIVHQIFLSYRRFISARLAVPADRQMSVADLVNYLETAFEAMWQFRFMFYDLPGLMARNPQLQADYHQFVNGELQTILESHFREFIRLGLLKMDLEDIEPVSVNIWLVVKFWFAFEQTARPKAPINEASGHRGVRQVLALLKPYVQADFLPAFQQLAARHHTEN
jgi:AcrR family transcriptional regulator